MRNHDPTWALAITNDPDATDVITVHGHGIIEAALGFGGGAINPGTLTKETI